MGNHRSLFCSKCPCIWQEREKFATTPKNIPLLEGLKVFH